MGAGGIVGPYLLERLVRAGYTIDCLSRRQAPSLPHGVRWTTIDLKAPGPWRCHPGTIAFCILPLWLVPPVLPCLSAARQIIAFGSTNVLTKINSADPHERALARRLRKAERDLATYCEPSNLPWTILRPTLIYGGGRDGNISAIAAFICRFGVFPIPSPARGLRQPVHADDLAHAAVAAVDNKAASNTALNLPGGETLTYREMVRKVFLAMGRRPVIVPLPEWLMSAGAKAFRSLEMVEYGPEAFRRMNRDLVFDDARARTVLGYAPRPFEPEVPFDQ